MIMSCKVFSPHFLTINPKKAIDLGASPYNLACSYAKTNNHKKAFEILEECLLNKKVDFNYVENDPDWINLIDHKRFKEIKDKYCNIDKC